MQQYLKTVSLFVFAEATLLSLSFEIFLKVDQERVGEVLIGFGVLQLAFLAIAMRVAERERNRGKTAARVAQEQSRRERVLMACTAGLTYVARLAFGLWHAWKFGWSQGLLVQLAIWTLIASVALYFEFPGLRVRWKQTENAGFE